MKPDILGAHQAFARSVFAQPDAFEWTTMGFGMIRTYLDPKRRWRLNVWDDRLAVPNVSDIHDHPWSFTSFIIAGEMHNTRFKLTPDCGVVTHLFHKIATGEGVDDRRRSPQEECWLRQCATEVYRPGDAYQQDLDEIHRTVYRRGTVTLNDRTPPTLAHTARVFWPAGTEWVTAMPRVATAQERDAAIEAALQELDWSVK